ncbi:MAG: hypothetical protein HQK79_05120 [Desulfobacterales bacterium]|nr:hypothetical protein [Desulfobacterales bacterium]
MFRNIMIFFIISMFFLQNASAEIGVPDVKTVTVWGEATATSDMNLDKQQAIANAKRVAVEQVVGVYVFAKTLVQNFQVVNDRIYSQSSGFINNFKVIKEERSKDMQKVQVEAQVSVSPVTDILRESGLLRQWRVGVILYADKQSMATGWSDTAAMEVISTIEATIGQQLVQAQFKVVDPRQLDRLRKKVKESDNIDTSSVSGLDLLVTGSVSLSARTVIGGINQAICQIHGKILRADTGEIVYQGNIGNTFDGAQLIISKDLASKYANTLGNGVLSDGTPDMRSFGGSPAAAIEKAVRLSGTIMSDVIISQITKVPAAASSKIMIELFGIEFNDLTELEDNLKTISGVSNVITEEFSGNIQHMEVEYDGDTNSLAKLLSKAKFFKNMRLKVTHVTKNKITLKK